MADIETDTVRLDMWLWRARLFKTRSAARDLAAKGRIRVTRPGRAPAPAKASFLVTAGDVILFRKDARTICVTVTACGVRRGPPAEARTLYTEGDGDIP